MKWILRTLGIVVVAVIVLVAAVVLNADRLIKGAVERQGTASLRLATSLSSARLSLLGGSLDLNGLAIAEPAGFGSPHLLEVSRLGLAVKLSELRGEPIHVASIRIDQPVLTIEQSGGTLNFRKAMALQPASPPDKKPLKLVVDQLDLKDARVVIRPGLPGLEKELTVDVPSLTLRDIGRGKGANNGAAIKDIAMHVVSALAAAAASSDQIPAPARALLHLNSAQVAAALGGEALHQISSAVPGNVGKALQSPAAAKEAGSLLQQLAPAGRSPKKR